MPSEKRYQIVVLPSTTFGSVTVGAPSRLEPGSNRESGRGDEGSGCFGNRPEDGSNAGRTIDIEVMSDISKGVLCRFDIVSAIISPCVEMTHVATHA